jgi:protein SCO1/2
MKPIVVLLALSAALQAAPEPADPKPILPPELRGIGIQQRLGTQVPTDAQFLDSDGNTVRLGQIATGKPVVLALVYYTCPMLCNQILSGLVAGLRPLSLQPARDFDIVAISINPSEKPADAAEKRATYVRKYSRANDPAGWHFLTGTDENIHKVADAVGFRYRYDPRSKMFIHASGVMILTPHRRVARYLYGVEYQPKDLKLGLIEAADRRIGSPVDAILLFCYHYDPAMGKYTLSVLNGLRAAAALALAVLVLGLSLLWRRDIRADRAVREAASK